MANEVIIEEYENIGARGGTDKPLPRTLVTTQILDIATASAQFNERTSFIRIQSKGTGFWWALGGASPSATANTAGSAWLPADQFRDIAINPQVDLKIDTAA